MLFQWIVSIADMKGLAKEHICVAHHRQECGDGQREESMGDWVEVGKEGEIWTSVIVSTIKIQLKN